MRKQRIFQEEERGGKERKSVVSILVAFSLPLILSGVLQQLYNWADAFIVGNVEGELALAAIRPRERSSIFTSLSWSALLRDYLSSLPINSEVENESIIKKILSTFLVLVGCVFYLRPYWEKSFLSPCLGSCIRRRIYSGLLRIICRLSL